MRLNDRGQAEQRPSARGASATRPAPRAGREAEILALQRAAGNRVVSRILDDGQPMQAQANPLRIGVPYRTDGRGAAHVEHDLKSVSAIGEIEVAAGGGQSRRAVPEGARGVTLPPNVRLDDGRDAAEAAPRDKSGNYAQAVADQRPTNWRDRLLSGAVRDLVREDLNEVEGLMITGAPVANDTQVASARSGAPGTDAILKKAAKERETAEHDSRTAYELELIRHARNLGMPVLALCAGSWRLLQAYGGQAETIPAPQRALHARNPDPWSLRHGVRPTPGSSIGKILERHPGVEVTSTHWASAGLRADQQGNQVLRPDPSREDGADPSDFLEVSAWGPEHAGQDGAEPYKETAEAFESKHGAPVWGIQWHPETHLPGMLGRRVGGDSGPLDPAAAMSEEIFAAFATAARAYRHRKLLNQQINELAADGAVKNILRATAARKASWWDSVLQAMFQCFGTRDDA